METGIEQKAWFDGTFGCIYTITNNSQRTNPGANYDSIAEGCRVGLGIGLMIVLNAIISMYALWDFNAGKSNSIVYVQSFIQYNLWRFTIVGTDQTTSSSSSPEDNKTSSPDIDTKNANTAV